MRTTILSAAGGEDAALAPGPIEVEAYCIGADDDALVLGVRPDSAGARSLGSGRLLLTKVLEPLELFVRPARGSTFPTGVAVGAQLTNAQHAEQVVLHPSSVAGAGEVVLLRLDPQDGRTVVRTEAVGLDLGGVAPASASGGPNARSAMSTTLPPEWERGVASMRRALGTASVDPAARVRAAVVVDLSASMLVEGARPATQALLDVVLAFVLLCGKESKAPVWAASAAAAKLPHELSREAGLELAAHLQQRVPTCGSLLAPALKKAIAARDVVFVITDDVPSDLASVRRLLETKSVRVHVLVLGSSSYEEGLALAPWQEELAAFRPLVEEGVLSVSSLAPAGKDRARRLDDDDVLDALTRSLVEAWQPS